METPTSPAIAIHIFAIPRTPKIITSALTAKQNTMFSFTILSVFLAIRIVFGIFSISSSMITISAASIAASDPILPIATPISALTSTGASLIPSPTNTSFSFWLSFSSNCSVSVTLSCGINSAWKLSRFSI